MEPAAKLNVLIQTTGHEIELGSPTAKHNVDMQPTSILVDLVDGNDEYGGRKKPWMALSPEYAAELIVQLTKALDEHRQSRERYIDYLKKP